MKENAPYLNNGDLLDNRIKNKIKCKLKVNIVGENNHE